jgi:hypothetical protein
MVSIGVVGYSVFICQDCVVEGYLMGVVGVVGPDFASAFGLLGQHFFLLLSLYFRNRILERDLLILRVMNKITREQELGRIGVGKLDWS